MNTPLPPRRGQGLSSTVRRLGTYWALMISRPSSLTQRTYGVSFSVANFLASSSEACGLPSGPLAIRVSFCPVRWATLAGKAGASTAEPRRYRGRSYAVRNVRAGPARYGRVQGDHPVGRRRTWPIAGGRDRPGIPTGQGRPVRSRQGRL